MRVTQRLTVAKPPDQVWAFLSDVQAVAQCVPGLELVDECQDGTYLGRFAVKVGPVSAKLEGEGRLERDHHTRSARIEGSGVDKRGGSRAKGVIEYKVVGEGTGSAIEVLANVNLSGPLAQIGRTAIIEDIARALTQEFSANLEARLGPQSPALETAGGRAASGTHSAPAPEAPATVQQQFDAGRAVSGALWQRVVQFFKRLIEGIRRLGTSRR